jgi:hypothetical protein
MGVSQSDDETGLTKSQRIDLGLAILEAVSDPGTVHTRAEIAAYCDCSVRNVAVMEKKALGKLRKGLRKAGVTRS